MKTIIVLYKMTEEQFGQYQKDLWNHDVFKAGYKFQGTILGRARYASNNDRAILRDMYSNDKLVFAEVAVSDTEYDRTSKTMKDALCIKYGICTGY